VQFLLQEDDDQGQFNRSIYQNTFV